jgi:glycosyltransferase involved in cell wall biosynthesis
MKILVLAWEFPPRIIGGISRHVAELYPEIATLGHEVHLITVSVDRSPNYEIIDGIVVHRVPVPHNHDFFGWISTMNARMVEYVEGWCDRKIHNFDLVHGHDWLVATAAIALAEKFHLPLVATIHATEHGRHHGIHTDTQRYIHAQELNLAHKATEVIVCSEYMRLEVNRVLHCPIAKTDVVYNGLSQERLQRFQSLDFDREEIRCKFAQPDEKIVYYVGRITYEKGIFLLINAVPAVLRALYGKVKFIVIGSGNTDMLKRQAWDLGIAHNVVFTGFMSDRELSKFQTIADCAVFPSLYEPFGIVALESFAARVPVVVSNSGGLPEVVSHGITGIVTEVNNSNSIASGIIEVLQNPEYSARLVKNAFQELGDRFAWYPLAKQTEMVYLKAIQAAIQAK